MESSPSTESGKSAIMTNNIVATIHSAGAPSPFLRAAYAIHGDLGKIQNETPAAVGSKSRNTPKSFVPILKRQDSQLVALVSRPNSCLRCALRTVRGRAAYERS